MEYRYYNNNTSYLSTICLYGMFESVQVKFLIMGSEQSPDFEQPL